MLLRSVLITDPASPHHGEVRDLRITNGVIDEIGSALAAGSDEETVTGDQLRVSPGFVDIGAYLGDPGHEEREDIRSLMASARAGGYVTVAVLPNTVPVRQTVADMAYLRSHSAGEGVTLLPLAALSHDTGGKDLTDMMELDEAGAVGFTDGPARSADGQLLKRGLQYARGFGGLVIDTPFDGDLAEEGQMHEGNQSVRLGLRGIPVMCETIPLRRALSIREYTGGRLLVHLVSTAESVDLIRAHGVSADGLTGVSVGAHHLCFTDAELTGFDPNFKMLPPLRGADDRAALRQGLLDGTVTAIVSHHRARHREEKDLEFSYATFGALGLETAFLQQLDWADTEAKIDCVIQALTVGPRRLLGLEAVHVAVGMPASLTLYTTAGTRTFGVSDLPGKTRNHPLLGRTLRGRIVGTVHNDRLWTSA